MKILRRLPLTVAIVAAGCLAGVASDAFAADFEISLQVKSAATQQSTKLTETQPSSTRPRPRPVFSVDANETLLVSWKAVNNSQQTTFQDVLIHCVVVAEKEPGQAAMPDLKNPEQESALTMDFKPRDSSTGEFTLKIDRPGAYLVRVETQYMADKYGHDYYAALDLICK